MVFCSEELQLQPHRRCKDMATGLRDAFTYCYRCKGRKVTLIDEEDDFDNPIEDFDYDHDIRSQAMAKLRQKPRMDMEKSNVLAPYRSVNEVSIKKEETTEEDIEFCSVGSSFSECLSELSIEAYRSAKTEFSACSSLKGVALEKQWKMYVNEIRKESVIQKLCHCQGWPFGLGRKAALLPPLPKSPAESWSWRKPTKVTPFENLNS